MPTPIAKITTPTSLRKNPRVAIAPSAEAKAAIANPLRDASNWLALKLKLTVGNPVS
jgi:hypothetical protein